jgi:hypothetical protein
MRMTTICLLAAAGLALAGCDRALTAGEALQAIEELSLESQALTVSSGTIELTTSFTIGQAVEAAAEELREFIETQLPCAEIALEGAALSIEYGANPGDCTYHGQTYSGTHSIEIVSAAEGDVVVHHEWTALSNGKVEVTGAADVTWSTAEGTRHVAHELDWTRLADGFAVTGSGDRTPAGCSRCSPSCSRFLTRMDQVDVVEGMDLPGHSSLIVPDWLTSKSKLFSPLSRVTRMVSSSTRSNETVAVLPSNGVVSS